MSEAEKIMNVLESEYGISSMEELDEAMKEYDGIDVGIFTMPIEIEKMTRR